MTALSAASPGQIRRPDGRAGSNIWRAGLHANPGEKGGTEGDYVSYGRTEDLRLR